MNTMKKKLTKQQKIMSPYHTHCMHKQNTEGTTPVNRIITE